MVLEESKRGRTEHMTRAQRHTQVRAMKRDGLTFDQIAAQLGLARSTVTDAYYDPSGRKMRERKERQAGECVDCGATTMDSGSKPPERCHPCATEHRRYWTRDRIIQAIRDWSDQYGAPPGAYDWDTGRLKQINPARWKRFYAGRWPHQHTVLEMFGSWNAAIAAAGFTPRKIGGRGPQWPPREQSRAA